MDDQVLSPEKMTMCLTLFWVISGGFLGGVFDFFNRFKIEVLKEKICFQGTKISFCQFLSLGVMNASLGIGGALAVQFVMISIGKFQESETVEVQMLLLTISVVAGFGGRRFLSLASSKLEDQIGEANRVSYEAKEEAEESIVISKALATIRPHATVSERQEAIKGLESALTRNPKDRMLTIMAGRLYRKVNNYKAAINILSNFLDKKGSERDKDYADVLYNRACYKILSSMESSQRDESLIESGLVDLKESITIAPENAVDAKEDLDFKEVEGMEEFKEIVS